MKQTSPVSKVSAGEPQPDAPAVTMKSDDPTKAFLGFRNMLDRVDAPSMLSEQGQHYASEIVRNCTAAGLLVQRLKTSKYETLLVSNTKNGVGITIIFAETYTRQTVDGRTLPPTYDPYLAELYTRAKNPGTGSSVKVAHNVVVIPQDYPRIQNMVRYLNNILTHGCDESVRTMRASSLCEDGDKLIIDNNINNVRKMVDMVSPHVIPDRCDIGCVVYLRSPINSGKTGAYTGGAQDYNQRPIFAVTGFTDFVEINTQHLQGGIFSNNGMVQTDRPPTMIIPFVTITNVSTLLPFRALSTLAFAAAAKSWIQRLGWMQPFDAPDGDDLGNLIMVEGKPFSARQPDVRNAFIGKCFLPPRLAFDCMQGRATLPMLKKFEDRGVGFKALASGFIDDFTGTANSMNLINVLPTAQEWPIVTGTFESGGQLMDSREIDYFALIKRRVEDIHLLSLFTTREPDPLRKLERLQQTCGVVVDPLYSGRNIVLDSSFVNLLIASLNTSKLNIQYVQQDAQVLDQSLVGLALNPVSINQVGLDGSTSMRGPFDGFGSAASLSIGDGLF